MIKIAIIPKNREKIEAALRDVNGRASSFAITSFDAVAMIAKRAEDHFWHERLNIKTRKETMVNYTPAGPSSAYKYNVKSTFITLIRGATKTWYLIRVTPAVLYPKQSEIFSFVYSSAAQAQIMSKLVNEFGSFETVEALITAFGGITTKDHPAIKARLLDWIMKDKITNPTLQSAYDAFVLALKMSQ